MRRLRWTMMTSPPKAPLLNLHRYERTALCNAYVLINWPHVCLVFHVMTCFVYPRLQIWFEHYRSLRTQPPATQLSARGSLLYPQRCRTPLYCTKLQVRTLMQPAFIVDAAETQLNKYTFELIICGVSKSRAQIVIVQLEQHWGPRLFKILLYPTWQTALENATFIAWNVTQPQNVSVCLCTLKYKTFIAQVATVLKENTTIWA